MLDIMNEIGIKYKNNNEKIKNLYDVFVSIYFPLLSYENFLDIIEILNGNEKKLDYWHNMFNVIRNDMILESEIYKTVEKNINELKKDEKFRKLFYPTNINQSIIHVNINNKKYYWYSFT